MKIFIEILLSVRELQIKKVIHRGHLIITVFDYFFLDLKPMNIFVDENFNIKVGDFGCARFISTGGKAQTRVGTLFICLFFLII
jgi:serine/threonine protein kinase